MNILNFAETCALTPVYIADENAEVSGAYCCDLLSWVIGRAEEGSALITVMTNVNVIAVCVMAELPCVILTEGVTIDPPALEKAKAQGISVLATPKTSFEAAVAVGKAL